MYKGLNEEDILTATERSPNYYAKQSVPEETADKIEMPTRDTLEEQIDDLNMKGDSKYVYA